MSGMDQELAAIYGTPGADLSQAEDLEKQAEAELFLKLAAENGINIDQLTDEQISELYDSTFGKVAQEGEEAPPFPPKKEEAKKCEDCGKEPCECDKNKEAAAQAEFLEKKAQQEKYAEADRMGRIMAHAYVQELRKIAEANGEEPPPAAKKEEAKKEEKDAGCKSASAIDELAVPKAIEKAAEAGWNKEEAAARVNAVATLGLQDSEKTASAGSVDEAVENRALEFLEAAGYPVTWNK